MGFKKSAAVLTMVAAAGLLLVPASAIAASAATENELEMTLFVNNSSLKTDSAEAGSTVRFAGSAEGGTEPYSFSYSYKRTEDSEWTPLGTSTSYYDFIPTDVGKFDIRCIVTDAEGNTVTDEGRLSVFKDTGREFKNISEVNEYTIIPGETVVFEAAAEGGNLPYEYKFFMKGEGDTSWKQVRAYDRSGSYTYVSEAEGNYSFKLRARDAGGAYKDQISTVKVTNDTGKPFVNSTPTGESTIKLGESVTFNMTAEGGKLPYDYKFFIQPEGKTDWTQIRAYKADPSFTYTPTAAGSYTVKMRARDAKGTYKDQLYSLKVVDDVEKPFENTSEVSDKTVTLGESVTLTASAVGGKAPYEYKFFIKADGTSSWTQIRSYNSDPTFTYVPSEAGIYTVKLRARDASGTYKDKTEKLTVKTKVVEELKNTSTLGSNSVTIFQKAVLNGSATGGEVPYQYKYMYKKSGTSEWTLLKGYSSTKTYSFSAAEGFYNVRIRVRDNSGKVVDKNFNLTIKTPTGLNFSNTSTVSSSLVTKGASVTMKASASGGSSPYQFRYYKEVNGNWVSLKGYSTTASYKVKFNESGINRLRVDVKDAEGAVRSKTFSIDVYQSVAKNTVAATDLMKTAKWATAKVKTVAAGTAVNVISQNGHWFRVKCGNSVGWIYNLALGSYKNYTSIDTSTIEYVADDIIFREKRSIKTLFDYVNYTTYTSMADLGYRENVAYLMRYRRGACYQRASLLCFLLDRAGYNVVRVDDGIDDYTGGGPHNWVIISTTEGWRHIDPTPVYGLRTFYLVKDSDISPYFTWDRTKYPVCN